MTPGFAARWFRSWKTSLLSQASILEEKAQSHIQAKLVKKKAAQEKVKDKDVHGSVILVQLSGIVPFYWSVRSR